MKSNLRIIVTTLLWVVAISAFGQLKISGLTTENLVNPIGIDVKQPKFGWLLSSDKRNAVQSAYEISVMNGKASVWNSGKISSDQSAFVAYAGKALESNVSYQWKVRVWDGAGKASAWSEAASFQIGLMNVTDWKASWIEPGYAEESSWPAAYFRKTFSASKKIKSATAYITAHGLYEAYINGRRIGTSYLTPGWTSYATRLQYQAYDVTPLLQAGANAIGVMTGNGWYRGNLTWDMKKNNIYGKSLGLLLQLEIAYTDGSKETVVSDGSWKSSTGSILTNEIYHGEMINANLEKTGWMLPVYTESGWSNVSTASYDNSNLIAEYNEPVRKHETFSPVKFITTPKNEKVIDFGQNLTGWMKITVQGNKGDTIKIHHAEVLDKEGNFYTTNLRGAKAESIYVLSGNGTEVFEPHFTFFGFRYIRVTGIRTPLKSENFTAIALYSDMAKTGEFETSNALINQLQHNIQWGQNGNFLDIPTDCPQRDERLGWTGDAQVFARTAAYNRNVRNFFSKWLKDVAADQQPDGRVPFVVPNVLGPTEGGSAGWADAATIIPWTIYQSYGDKSILEQQYASMKLWVSFMEQNSKDDLWNKGFHFGDWLFYRPDDDNDGRAALTDKYLIAQCFFAQSTQILVNTAQVLGKKEDEQRYMTLLKKVKDAFVKEYVTASGRLVSSSQTAYVLALQFDMLPESRRQYAAERLVENIKSYRTHLTTGFLGTPYLCHVLSRFGYSDVAYQLLLQESYPSWLYPVKMGATTIWERWDGQKPDGSFQTPGMNSFNHYSYGAIGDWMYCTMAGINSDPSAPGYKKIVIKPVVGGSFSDVKASLKTNYGKVSSRWTLISGKFQLEVEIPVNTTAKIYVPAGASGVMEGGKAVSGSQVKDGYVEVIVGSGHYEFSSELAGSKE